MRNIAIARAAILAALATLVAAPSLAVAAGGYGPTISPATVPGGFTTVVAAHTFGPLGGTVKATVGTSKVIVQLVKPAVQKAELEITKPNLTKLESALPGLGLKHRRLISAVGVALVEADGTPIPSSKLQHSVKITLQGAEYAGTVKAFEFSGASKLQPLHVTHVPGKPPRITLTLSGGGDLFVVG